MKVESRAVLNIHDADDDCADAKDYAKMQYTCLKHQLFNRTLKTYLENNTSYTS